MSLEVVVLAAGQGTRMKSHTPKVLHEIGGKPMLERVLDSVKSLEPSRIHVVVSSDDDEVQQRFRDYEINWVTQSHQLGTGHAVLQALPALENSSQVLVVYGDCPLLQPPTLKRCIAAGQSGIGLITADVPDPTGFGRIIRDQTGDVNAIVEQTDLSAEQCQISEINSGILSTSAEIFKQYLPQLTDDNAQGEIYLTDLIATAGIDGVAAHGVKVSDHREVLGVNDRVQLAQVERIYQLRQAERMMKQGVTFLDPSRFDCRGTVNAGRDCVLDVNVILEGAVELGDEVRVGGNCILRDVQIATGTEIKANSVIENATIGQSCVIGPFARIRPGSVLEDNVNVGNFVEIKNSRLADGVKAGHLAYLGDAEVGTESNIGAGAITCNFDGKNKHRTVIGDNVFIGSNSSLIAPLTIASGAAVAAGSSISRNVNEDELVIERASPRNVRGGGTRFRRR